MSGRVPRSGPAHVGGGSSPARHQALPGVYSGQMAALGQLVLTGCLGVGGHTRGFWVHLKWDSERRGGWGSNSFRFYCCGQEDQKPFADWNLFYPLKLALGTDGLGPSASRSLSLSLPPCKMGMIYL